MFLNFWKYGNKGKIGTEISLSKEKSKLKSSGTLEKKIFRMKKSLKQSISNFIERSLWERIVFGFAGAIRIQLLDQTVKMTFVLLLS